MEKGIFFPPKSRKLRVFIIMFDDGFIMLDNKLLDPTKAVCVFSFPYKV